MLLCPDIWTGVIADDIQDDGILPVKNTYLIITLASANENYVHSHNEILNNNYVVYANLRRYFRSACCVLMIFSKEEGSNALSLSMTICICPIMSLT